MNQVVAILPTDAAIEAAWERYASMCRRAIDDPKLLLDRAFAEEFARATEAWRIAYLASLRTQC